MPFIVLSTDVSTPVRLTQRRPSLAPFSAAYTRVPVALGAGCLVYLAAVTYLARNIYP